MHRLFCSLCRSYNLSENWKLIHLFLEIFEQETKEHGRQQIVRNQCTQPIHKQKNYTVRLCKIKWNKNKNTYTNIKKFINECEKLKRRKNNNTIQTASVESKSKPEPVISSLRFHFRFVFRSNRKWIVRTS